MTIEVLRKNAGVVAENRTRMNAAFEECREAEKELIDHVMATVPAIEAICSPIQLTEKREFLAPKMSIWRGVQLDTNGPLALYLDESHRLLLFRYHAGRDADVEVITAAQAVRDFQVEKMVENLTIALERQLQGKSLVRTKEALERAAFLRSITTLIKSRKS
jgi:hypothetical protein